VSTIKRLLVLLKMLIFIVSRSTCYQCFIVAISTHTHPFYGPFSGHPGELVPELVSWSLTSLFSTNMAISETKLVSEENFRMQGKIDRGRHTNHPAVRHSIRTNQCPPPPSPIFYWPEALSATQPTVSKHWRQLAHSD